MISRRLAVFAPALLLLSSVVASAEGEVSFEAVNTGVASGKMVLVDVREPDEFVSGHIPGSINLPLSRFSPEMLPVGDNVVLTCRSGRRAGQARMLVEATGRRDVGVYLGSMLDWTAKKGPVAMGR